MTFKALLLGSAAALATAGGAQAADLMADSVDYVKVCDAFGSGYWYIPGSDTCIKFEGRFRYEAYFGEGQGKSGSAASGGSTTWLPVVSAGSIIGSVQTSATAASAGSANQDGFNMLTRADLTVMAAKMTAHGPLIGSMTMTENVRKGSGGSFSIDSMWLQWGHLTFGYDDTLLRPTGSYSLSGASAGRLGESVNFARLDWALGAHTLSLAVEDQWATGGVGTSRVDDELPMFAAKLVGSHEHIGYGVAAGWAPGGTLSDGFAVSGYAEIKLDSIAKGDRLKIAAAYGEDAAACGFYGICPATGGDSLGWFVSFRHNWGNGWQSNITYSDRDASINSQDRQEVWFNTLYKGIPGLEVGPEIRWVNYDAPVLPTTDTTYAVFRVQWDWD